LLRKLDEALVVVSLNTHRDGCAAWRAGPHLDDFESRRPDDVVIETADLGHQIAAAVEATALACRHDEHGDHAHVIAGADPHVGPRHPAHRDRRFHVGIVELEDARFELRQELFGFLLGRVGRHSDANVEHVRIAFRKEDHVFR
jgi:hypothetical protein